MDYRVKYYGKKASPNLYSSFVLGGDIGGTNTNFGIMGIRDGKPVLLFSLHFETRRLKSVIPAVKSAVNYAKQNYAITVEDACIGAAGPVSPGNDFCQPTNVKWSIDAREVLKKTPLKSLFLINDFGAIGYGINLLDHKDPKAVLAARAAKKAPPAEATRAVMGAGTGLGKAILVYKDAYGIHVPIPSEGGHADFPVYDEDELRLIEFVKKHQKLKAPASYENVLSGRGIESIYAFLKGSGRFAETECSRQIDKAKEKTPLITKNRAKDELCRETFKLFTRFYARCAKNFVLDSLATGGLYVAGGIAARAREVFQTKEFLDEFENANRQRDVLKDTPIYIVADYNVSLYGAGLAAVKRRDLAIRGD